MGSGMRDAVSFHDPRDAGRVFTWDLRQGLLFRPGEAPVSLHLNSQHGQLLLRFLACRQVGANGDCRDAEGSRFPADIPVRSALPRMLDSLGVRGRAARDLFVTNIRGFGYQWHPKEAGQPLDSPNSEAEIRLGAILKQDIPIGQIEAAETIFKRAVALFLTEDYQEATALLNELCRQQQNPRWLLNLGYLLFQQSRFAEALEAFKQAVSLDPYFVEGYLNAYRACLKLQDFPQARKFCDAAYRLAPQRADVLKARAGYFLEIGELQDFFREMAKVPDPLIFNKPEDNDPQRLKEQSSVLAGNRSVDVMMFIFAGAGLRTVLLGYRDQKNRFPKPRHRCRWHPLKAEARQAISIELIDTDDADIAMVGYRVNGLEQSESQEALGFITASFQWDDFGGMTEDNYVGLLQVDWDRQLRLEPRRFFVSDLLKVAEGDLVDLYQDMVFPTARYTGQDNLRPRVFLSYAQEDDELVGKIAEHLRQRGIDVWKANLSLRTGDHFKSKIDEAIEESDFAVIFLSRHTAKKRGFVHQEIRKIIETARQCHPDKAYLLPVRLDDGDVPTFLRELHWVLMGDDLAAFSQKLADDILKHFID